VGIDLQDLAKQVARLQDLEAIRTLKNTYHLYINDRCFSHISSLFTTDAVVDFGYMHNTVDPWKGSDQINNGFKFVESNLSEIKQFIHSHTIDLDGDQASGWCFLEARYGLGNKSFNVAGKYDEDYRKVDGKWLFSRMNIHFYFTTPHELGWVADNRHQLARRPVKVV
jgi:hypothetical protein